MAILAYYAALARYKLRGALYSLIGVIFILIGVVFLVSLLWMVLSEMRDAKFAAQVLGFGFLAVGMIFLGVGKLISRLLIAPVPVRHPVARSPMIGIVEGFLVGMAAGRRRKSARSRPRDDYRQDD